MTISDHQRRMIRDSIPALSKREGAIDGATRLGVSEGNAQSCQWRQNGVARYVLAAVPTSHDKSIKVQRVRLYTPAVPSSASGTALITFEKHDGKATGGADGTAVGPSSTDAEAFTAGANKVELGVTIKPGELLVMTLTSNNSDLTNIYMFATVEWVTA